MLVLVKVSLKPKTKILDILKMSSWTPAFNIYLYKVYVLGHDGH